MGIIKGKNKIIFIFFLFVCIVIFKENINASNSKTGADFLSIGIGARPAGTGEAFSAVAEGVDAIYYNPSGLAWAVYPEIQATHALWFGDVKYEFLGYIHPTRVGTFGLGIQYLYMDKMYKISQGLLGDTFSVYNGMAVISYGKSLSEKFSIGLNMKGLESKLDNEKAQAFASDAGVLFRSNKEGSKFSLSLVGQNFGPQMKFIKVKEDLPINIKLGLAGNLYLPKQYSDINFIVDVNKPVGGDYNFCFGLEHWEADKIALRVGYKYELDDNKLREADSLSGWTFGLGIKNKIFLLDYAFVPYGGMGYTHRISLGSRFAEWGTKEKTPIEVEVLSEPEQFSPNNDKIKDEVVFSIMLSNIGEIKNWFFEIRDAEDNLIKKYSGKNKAPVKIMWKGTDEIKDIVNDGKYKYFFQAKGKGRKTARSKEGWVVVDTEPPVINWSVFPEIISPNGDGNDDEAVISFSTDQVKGIESWKVDITTQDEKIVRNYEGKGPIPPSIVWDAKDDYYKKTVPNGKYLATLSVSDKAGNKGISLPEIIKVDVPPKVEVKHIKVKEEARGLLVNLSSNVLFVSGKSALKKESYKALDEVFNLLKAYPENKVSIEGHTDSVGSESFNRKLSLERAKAVYNVLVAKGVDQKRVSIEGFGEAQPIASNATRQGRAQNRRVDIIILK